MGNWGDLLSEINAFGSAYDQIRRKTLKELHEVTHRNVIVYYSAWLQKGHLARGGLRFDINDSDKSGFMTAIHGLERSKGLDLILHTPGGDTAAAESIIDYLRSMFGTDIRAIIPQLAMSAGTLAALACKSIVMGKQSSLGPIDPQVGGLAAHGVIEEFGRAKTEIVTNPVNAALWQPILHKYQPTLLGECQKAIDWSNSMAKDWLVSGMFQGESDAAVKADAVVKELGSHVLTLSHSRHISITRARDLGLKIEALEDSQPFQDAVLTLHHACIHTLASTAAYKIIENHNGVAYIPIVHQQLLVN
jgi:hypothetical protein